MLIKKINIQNIRCHSKLSIDLSNKTTAITGVNGSGKTSILEAIYLSLRGGSFRSSDLNILQDGASWWKVDVTLDGDSKRVFNFDNNLDAKRKKVIINGKTTYRLPPKNKYPVVLFEPDDLRLLHGSPERRRKFIDSLISQIDPTYDSYLRKYNKALKQRNGLLKKDSYSNDELFVWNVTLGEYGAYIIEQRIAYIEIINQSIGEIYKSIAHNDDTISIHYSSTYIGDIKQKLLNEFELNLSKDKILGFTSTGPHRHDIKFNFNGHLALDVASRGEIRSIVLSLKFVEVDIIEKATKLKPIILLDDVFSELDDKRQRSLLKSDGQVIITSTKLPDGMKDQKITNIKL